MGLPYISFAVILSCQQFCYKYNWAQIKLFFQCTVQRNLGQYLASGGVQAVWKRKNPPQRRSTILAQLIDGSVEK